MKATQCPVCKKGKRESDPYCSAKCAETALAQLTTETRNASLRPLQFGVCPACGGKAVISCRCMRADSRCENGHWWHHDGPLVHPGESDHASVVCCRETPIARVEKE